MKLKLCLITLALAAGLVTVRAADAPATPKVGDAAPLIEGKVVIAHRPTT